MALTARAAAAQAVLQQYGGVTWQAVLAAIEAGEVAVGSFFDRVAQRLAAGGLKGENFLKLLANASGNLLNGRAEFGAVYLKAGDVITGGQFCVAVSITGSTLVKMGLYDSTFTRVAVSADASAAINGAAAGTKQIAFTGTYTVPADGTYYVALLIVGSTAGAKDAFSASSSRQATDFNGFKIYCVLTAQADLTAGPLAPVANSSTFDWLAVY